MGDSEGKTDPPLQLEEGTSLSLTEVASRLGLTGEHDARYCPACQRSDQSGDPSLILQGDTYECFRCGVRGDAVALVCLVRKVEPDDAAEWLARQKGTNAGLGEAPSPHQLYRAFLNACRPLPDKVLVLLEPWGVTAEVASQLGLRYYSRGYTAMITSLIERFGVEPMAEAGLIVKNSVPARGSFQDYHDHKVPYLVLPYRSEGETVYLRAKPLIDPSLLDQWELPRMMATAESPPQPFNIDQLKGDEKRVLIFRWEMDAMTAMSLGLPAVACPEPGTVTDALLAKISKDTQVYLVHDSPKADIRQEPVLERFEAEELPAPEPLYVIPGEHLRDCLVASLNLEVKKQQRSARPDAPPGFIKPGDSGVLDTRALAAMKSSDAATEDSGDEPSAEVSPDALDLSADGAAEAEDENAATQIAPSVQDEEAEDGQDAKAEQPRPAVGPDELIAAVPSGPKTVITVHRQSVGSRNFIRARYWTRKNTNAEWEPEKRLNFIIPLDKADGVIKALQAAIDNRKLNDMPEPGESLELQDED